MKKILSLLLVFCTCVQVQVVLAKPKKHPFNNVPGNVVIEDFTPLPSRFPKCEGDIVKRTDFRILTRPRGHESSVVLSPAKPDGTFSNSYGLHSITAKINYSKRTRTYKINKVGEFIPVANLPKPKLKNLSLTKVEYGKYGWSFEHGHIWYEAKMTVSGGQIWNPIGVATHGPNSPFSTSKATTWGITTGAEGEIFAQIPFVAGGKITVNVGGSWQQTATHIMNSGPDPAPNSWRYGHYQKAIGLGHSVASRYAYGGSSTAPPNPMLGGWINDPSMSTSGVVSHPLSGYAEFLETKEKTCY